MSKMRRVRKPVSPEITELNLVADSANGIDTDDRSKRNRSGFAYMRNNLWVVAVLAFLAIGASGAVLKYLEANATKESAGATKDRSVLASLNPFSAAPLPTPTPQLSKEYVYAGSRLLAVEDANASAVPPADLAVWRPSTGVWYVLGGPGSTQTFYGWGASGDQPAQGDYDGDGKTDFCVVRPNGTSYDWYIVYSATSTTAGFTFQTNGDKLVVADYDGDGKSDPAVYHPATGYWYWLKSSDNYASTGAQQFGLSTDVPVPADYDGDGKADITVFRGSNTGWYTARSSDSTLQTATFGNSGDEPVSGDYDGDGKANYALRHNADWTYLQANMSTVTTISWQNATDKAVQNDYDGDGICDIAVWRESTGYWYIRQSSNSTLRSVQWGQAADIPVPAFFRR